MNLQRERPPPVKRALRASYSKSDPPPRASSSLSGRIRVTAGEGFVGPLTDLSAAFTELHPDCTDDLSITPDLVKLAHGASDVAIRTLHPGEPPLIYPQLKELEFWIFFSPEIAVRPGLRTEALPTIGLLPPRDQLRHMKAARAAGFGTIRIRSSSFAAQLAAVQRGNGAAALFRVRWRLAWSNPSTASPCPGWKSFWLQGHWHCFSLTFGPLPTC